MKDLGIVQLPKGTVGCLSENGMYNYWYPNSNDPIVIPIDTNAEHLHMWKHQGSYMAFKVPLMIFHPEDLAETKKEYVCIWFHQDTIETLNERDDTDCIKRD